MRSIPLAAVTLAAALLAGCADRSGQEHRAAESAAAVTDSGPALEVVTPAGTRRFTLAQLRAAIPADTALVRHDPSYEGRTKRYLGIPLDGVLTLAGLRPSVDEVLYFQAADGFRATLAAQPVEQGVRGIVAFADLDASGAWEPVRHGKEQVSPTPFYLVWTDSAGADSSAALRRPWPYQLVRIEAVDPRRKYDRIYPEGVPRTDPVYRGYVAFVVESHGGDQCVSCHSLNLQGGTSGPELNIPRNVTEYRDDATISAFIRNPRGFRARSPMPPFEGLVTDQEISDILAYLRWMRGRKAAPDSASAR